MLKKVFHSFLDFKISCEGGGGGGGEGIPPAPPVASGDKGAIQR